LILASEIKIVRNLLLIVLSSMMLIRVTRRYSSS